MKPKEHLQRDFPDQGNANLNLDRAEWSSEQQAGERASSIGEDDVKAIEVRVAAIERAAG